MSWSEIALYAFIVLVALHFVVGFTVYFIAVDQEDKKRKHAEALKLAQKKQAEDDRIEAMRLEREAAYYARQAAERKAYAPTTVMPLVDPQDIKKP